MATVFHKESPTAYELTLRLLYEQYAFRLLQLAYAFLKNKELAEEVVNDVFLSVWKRESRLNEIESIYPYLCRAIKNKALDYLASSKKTYTFSSLDLQADHIGFVMNPEHIMLNKELNERLKQAVQSLPPRCRLIFKLTKEDGMKCREVAKLLELSVRTVETQLAIALKRIGESLLPYMPEQEILQKVRNPKSINPPVEGR